MPSQASGESDPSGESNFSDEERKHRPLHFPGGRAKPNFGQQFGVRTARTPANPQFPKKKADLTLREPTLNGSLSKREQEWQKAEVKRKVIADPGCERVSLNGAKEKHASEHAVHQPLWPVFRTSGAPSMLEPTESLTLEPIGLAQRFADY